MMQLHTSQYDAAEVPKPAAVPAEGPRSRRGGTPTLRGVGWRLRRCNIINMINYYKIALGSIKSE